MADVKTSAVSTDTALGIADYFVGVQDIGGTPATVKYSPKVARRKILVTVSPSATPSINVDNGDVFTITSQNAAITSMTTNLSGTPADGDMILIRILDDGTARGVTWGASFASGPGTLPTTTIVNKWLYTLFMYSSSRSKHICMATGSEQ